MMVYEINRDLRKTPSTLKPASKLQIGPFTGTNSSIMPTTRCITIGVCGFVTVALRNGATLTAWAAVKLSIFPSGSR